MKPADGQQSLDGEETVDPRIERAAKALWWRDALRTWRYRDDAEYQAKKIWPRVRSEYVTTARIALDAADR